MQLITTKNLPPLPKPVQRRYAAQQERTEGVLETRAVYCPSMDLVATYPVFVSDLTDARPPGNESGQPSDEQQGYEEDDDAVCIDVWRLNGQKVFTVSVESDTYDAPPLDVIDVAWRSDGQVLAVLLSDGDVRLVNSFSGKIVHTFTSHSSYDSPSSPGLTRVHGVTPHMSSKPRPSVLSYTTHFSTPLSTWTDLERAGTEQNVVLDDLLGLNADIQKLLKTQADLPRELAAIDVEAYLPRLACLPPVGYGMEDLFSTRTSIDAIFHSSKRNLKSGAVDVLLAGANQGKVHVRVLDSFEVGDIDLATASNLPQNFRFGRVLRMAGHPLSSHIFAIVENQQTKGVPQSHLFVLDLKFIARSSTILPTLATKATQLQNLLRYLLQIQSQLAREVKTAFDLPTRFLRTLNEDLAAQDGTGSSFTTAAYHALVTGEVNGVFKEWLTDTLGERGVKRWEKAVGDCLELVRRLVSEGWSPAVERAGVVVSRLAGLGGWTDQIGSDGLGLGIDRRLVEGLRDTIDVMAIRGEDLLQETNRELSGFGSFVKWLKWEVEAAALEDTSERLDEMREHSEHGETLKVLEYIESGPAESVIKDYIGDSASRGTAFNGDDIGFYARFKEQRKHANQISKAPTFAELADRMKRQCDKLFERIAMTLRQGISSSHVAQLPLDLDGHDFDVKMLSQPEHGKSQVHVVGRSTARANEVIYTVINTDAKRPRAASPVVLSLKSPDTGKIRDVTFVDDLHFMVLVEKNEGTMIYGHAIADDGEASNDSWELRHTFEGGLMEAGMKPDVLEINGRKGRRAVAVVDRSGRGYSVYDLDSGDVQEEDAVMTG